MKMVNPQILSSMKTKAYTVLEYHAPCKMFPLTCFTTTLVEVTTADYCKQERLMQHIIIITVR